MISRVVTFSNLGVMVSGKKFKVRSPFALLSQSIECLRPSFLPYPSAWFDVGMFVSPFCDS